MSGDRLEVNVTFDSARGHIASAPDLRHPIVALSLASLRKRIEIALLPDDFRVVLHLDGSPSGNVIGGRRRRSYCAA